MKFQSRWSVVEAHRWHTNGDHPYDGTEVFPPKGAPGTDPRYTGELAGQRLEGKVVRYYRRPYDDGNRRCSHCGNTMHAHGWIDSGGEGRVVCPGDWILTIVTKGWTLEHYPCKPEVFAALYEPLEEKDENVHL